MSDRVPEEKTKGLRAALTDNPVVPVLLGSVTALAALLATFGGADGARRNHQTILLISVIVVGVALLLGGFAALPNLLSLAGAGMVVLVAGLLVAAYAALDHHAGRPQISASLISSPTEHIEARIVRDGLGATDQMEASVEGYSTMDGNDHPTDTKHDPIATLYRASFGPDESGQAALSFQLPVPTNEEIKSILLRTWVTSGTAPVDLSCSKPGENTSADIKHWAACVLIVLP